MSITLYLNNDKIKVTETREKNNQIEVVSVETISLEEGSIINGVIFNEQAVSKALLQVKNKIKSKSVSLIVDGGFILVKKLKVPSISESMILTFVQTSFASAATGHDELMYDYSILGVSESDASNKILAVAAERKTISTYIDLFKMLGFKLTKIDIGINALIKLVHNQPNIKDKTSIVAYVDENAFHSLLFVNGEFEMNIRTRLVSEDFTDAYYREIINSISSTIQFQQGLRSGTALSQIYLGGLNDIAFEDCKKMASDFNIVLENLHSIINITTQKDIAEYLFNIGVVSGGN